MILDHDNKAVSEERFAEIASALTTSLDENKVNPATFSQQLTRQAKHFTFPASISFKDDKNNNQTVMEVIAYDRPGLLARVGSVLSDCDVQLINAKIATYGERAEDIFIVADEQSLPINEATQNRLRQNLEEELNN